MGCWSCNIGGLGCYLQYRRRGWRVLRDLSGYEVVDDVEMIKRLIGAVACS